jgi:hypothetical protein
VVWVLLGLGKLNDVDLFFPHPCFGLVVGGCLAFLTQVVKVISLYLHSSDAAEVMNKQEQIARQLVESEFGHKSEEHKSKLITSTFRHLSTRYIDGISFTSSTRGIDDTEDDIEQKF